MSGGGGSKQKETANEKALAEVSKKQIARYKEKFSPLMGDLQALADEDRSGEFRGMANADTMQSLSKLPSAPGSNGRTVDVSKVGTRSLGSALTGASNTAEDRSYALTKGVMDAAQGANQTSMDGMTTAASISNADATSKLKADIDRQNRNLDLAGSVVGAATSYGTNRYLGSSPAGGMGARSSVRTNYSTGNGMRDRRTGFSGVGL